jgi:Ca2+-binding RTX toxin-like protein
MLRQMETVVAARRTDRPRPIRRLGSVLAALLIAALMVGVNASPAWAATCSGDTTMTIDLASAESIRLTLNGAEDPRTIEVTPADPSCTGFDTGTVSTIRVNGTGGNEGVTIDQGGSAPFPHQDTTSIDVALGGGTDTLIVIGQTTADTIGVGKGGISLDGGSDPDVTGLGSVETVTVDAGGGDDIVSARKGQGLGETFANPVTIDGETGNDTLTGGNANDAIAGGTGNDELKGSEGADTVDGGAGGDVVSGGGGNDVVKGGDGKDLLKGGANGDTMDGGRGNDTLTGGGGDDVLNGGDGNDDLDGGGGGDDLQGDAGKDQLSGGPGDDHCIGGPDPDSITGCESGHP